MIEPDPDRRRTSVTGGFVRRPDTESTSTGAPFATEVDARWSGHLEHIAVPYVVRTTTTSVLGLGPVVSRAVLTDHNIGAISGSAPVLMNPDQARRADPREREVFDPLVTGLSTEVIAIQLRASPSTIEVNWARVCEKHGARTCPTWSD